MPHPSRRGFLKHSLAAAVGMTAGWRGAGLRAAKAAEQHAAIRFAICNETFQDWPFDKAFALAAECGYTGLEIAPFTIANDVREISPKKRAEVRRQAEKAKLQILGLHWLLAKTEGFHLTSPEAAVRRKTAEYLAELARFCAELGGKILVFGSPKQRSLLPGVSRAQAMEHAAEVIRAVLPVLERTGTVLALEPLSPSTTDFLTTAGEAVELVRKIASPRCRLHLDCLAMSSEPTPIPELIRKHRADLVHFHANDANGQGPGFGRIDFVPIFKALREIGYRGWVSVEVFDASPGPERLARRSIEYMQKAQADLPKI